MKIILSESQLHRLIREQEGSIKNKISNLENLLSDKGWIQKNIDLSKVMETSPFLSQDEKPYTGTITDNKLPPIWSKFMGRYVYAYIMEKDIQTNPKLVIIGYGKKKVYDLLMSSKNEIEDGLSRPGGIIFNKFY